MFSFGFIQNLRRKSKTTQVEISPPPPYTHELNISNLEEESRLNLATRTRHRNMADSGTQTDAVTQETSSPVILRTSRSLSPVEIQATDIPQWLWSTAQCRAWLMEAFKVYLDMEPDIAEAEARRYKGSGTLLYISKRAYWGAMFGVERGGSIYGLLCSLRNMPGARPANL